MIAPEDKIVFMNKLLLAIILDIVICIFFTLLLNALIPTYGDILGLVRNIIDIVGGIALVILLGMFIKQSFNSLHDDI